VGPVIAGALGFGRGLWLGAYTAGSNLGRWLTRGGIMTGAGVMALGAALSLQRGGGWSFDPDVGFIGFFIMALFAVRSGHEEQRELGLSTFLRHNLVSPAEHAFGLVVALIATWVAVCAAGLLAMLFVSVGDVGTAAWYTAAWGLRLLVLLGFVPLVESVASLRLPLIVPVIVYWGVAMVLVLVLPEDEAIALFIPVERGDLDALARLGQQGVVAFLTTAGIYVGFSVAGPRLRLRLQRLVPFRH